MSLQSTANKKLSGLLHGALAGLIYGFAEYAIVILEPLLRWGPRSLGPEHWYWEIIFLALYTIGGAGIGAGASLLPNVRCPGRAGSGAVAAAGVAILLAGILFSEPVVPLHLVLCAALASLGAAALYSAFAFSAPRWLSWFSSPWVSIPLVFACIKIAESSAGATGLGLALFAIFAVTAAVMLAASRIRMLQHALDNRFALLSISAFPVLLAALASFSVFASAPPPVPTVKPALVTHRPNVLLIVLDTVRADHLSAYGYTRRTTPHLETLAHKATLYRNAISAADMTLSSYGSMYTGLYPSWHAARPNPSSTLAPLRSSFVTLAEHLAANGYTTLAVLANFGYLRQEFGMHQGFGFYDVRPPIQQSGGERSFYLRRALRPLLGLVMSTAELDRVYRRADQITEGALRIVSSMGSRGAPFFLSLNYMDAHEPYMPPSPYRNLFPGRDRRFTGGRQAELRRELAAHRLTPRTTADLQHIVSQYDGALNYMDAQIQLLLDGLKQAGLYDNTMIIVTADHGEALGERDDLGHPASVHQELVHVPLIIKYPRSSAIPAGQQIADVASGVDLVPTVLEVAGIPAPAGLQGHSLLHSIDIPGRFVISESFVDNHLKSLHRRSDEGQRALYQGPWKFIASTTGEKELYNWTTDPAELQNLYHPGDAISRGFSKALDGWLEKIPRANAPQEKKMDRQTLERLRGLGYIR